MSTKTIAFERGLALLRASGAQYAILYEGQPHITPNLQWAMKVDDLIFGNLSLVEAEKWGRGPAKAPRREWANSTGYLAALKLMQPGENWYYTCIDKDTATALQKVVSSTSGQLWGLSNFITTVDADFKLEVLRVA